MFDNNYVTESMDLLELHLHSVLTWQMTLFFSKNGPGLMRVKEHTMWPTVIEHDPYFIMFILH